MNYRDAKIPVCRTDNSSNKLNIRRPSAAHPSRKSEKVSCYFFAWNPGERRAHSCHARIVKSQSLSGATMNPLFPPLLISAASGCSLNMIKNRNTIPTRTKSPTKKSCPRPMYRRSLQTSYLKERQRDFMPEDTKAGMIQAFLDSYPGDTVCSKQLYKEALNHAFDEPKQWEIREINEIMNQCVTGWNYFSNPRLFAGYGRQKGWERENARTEPATDSGNGTEKIP